MLFSLFLNMMKTEHWGRLKDTQTPCAPLTLTPSHLWQSSSLKWWASTSMTSTFTLVLMRYGNIVLYHYIRYFQYSLMLSCMCRKGHLMHRKVFTKVSELFFDSPIILLWTECVTALLSPWWNCQIIWKCCFMWHM